MKYAVTGASGFVGGAIARQLVAAGHDVRLLLRSPGRSPDLAALGEVVEGDLADGPALAALCEGVDGLFHVAGWYKLGDKHPEDGVRTNVEGTRAVLAAARDAGTRVVYTSTLAVNSDTHGHLVDEDYRFEGTHLSTYDRTKAQAHDIALAEAARGLEIVIVQPGLVYGPGDTSITGAMIAAVVAGRRPLVPESNLACFGYVDDIAAGHLLAMERGQAGRSYLLAGPVATLADGLRIAADVAGTHGPIVLPTWVVRAMSGVIGAVGRIVPLHGTYSPEVLRQAGASYLGDPARAISELGWSARGIREGMETTVASLRA